MSYKPLWTPWRIDYILDSKKNRDEECLFCRILREGRSKSSRNLVVDFLPGAFIMLNRYPYTNGHLMVVPEKHRSRLSDYSTIEVKRLFEAVKKSEKMLAECLECEGMNIGINQGKVAGAGLPGHLHVHVVPRWSGDTNYMAVLADVRMIPQHIRETHAALRRWWKKNARER